MLIPRLNIRSIRDAGLFSAFPDSDAFVVGDDEPSGILEMGNNGSRLCFIRLTTENWRLNSSVDIDSRPCVLKDKSSELCVRTGVKGDNWKNPGSGARICEEPVEPLDPGRSTWSGLAGRKKDAEGCIPPAWVPECDGPMFITLDWGGGAGKSFIVGDADPALSMAEALAKDVPFGCASPAGAYCRPPPGDIDFVGLVLPRWNWWATKLDDGNGNWVGFLRVFGCPVGLDIMVSPRR